MCGRGRPWKAAGAAVFAVSATTLWWLHHELYASRPQPSSEHLNLKEAQARVKPGSATAASPPSKSILVWNTFWGLGPDTWEHIFFRQTSRQCPESRCELVYDHGFSDTADALLFHHSDIGSVESLPQRHPPQQLWIFFSLEPPPVIIEKTKVQLRNLGGIFNWTMTYRRDSDVVVPYGLVHPSPTAQKAAKDYWAGKSIEKMAVWIVSHCQTASQRELYVKELEKYIQVDIFGTCGQKKCGTRFTVISAKTVNMTDCNNEIQQYMFYLAFENSICLDYITEKFYQALQLEIVPVVLGGGSYKDVAPPDSFVDALTFPSPEHLASYLKKLASDQDAYNKFFEWKQHFSVELGHPLPALVCDLCAKLHDPSSLSPPQSNRSQPRQTEVVSNVTGRDGNGSYPDIEKWLLQGGECRNGSWTKGRTPSRIPSMLTSRMPHRTLHRVQSSAKQGEKQNLNPYATTRHSVSKAPDAKSDVGHGDMW